MTKRLTIKLENVINLKGIATISGKIKICQRRANGAKDVLTAPFLHVQKFGINISTPSANFLLIELYAQIVTILLILISP